MVDQKRVRILNDLEQGNGPVIYWMHRDQRVCDNWALLYAQELALEAEVPLLVVFCLDPKQPNTTQRQTHFMLKGLEEIETDLKALNIHFFLILGTPECELLEFADTVNAGVIITDFTPFPKHCQLLVDMNEEVGCPLIMVDAHNIVPCWVASPKLEIGARTLRTKIHKQLSHFLTEFPELEKHPYTFKTAHKKTNWKKVYEAVDADVSVGEVDWIKPGEREAKKALQKFIRQGLGTYDEKRNDPTCNAQSNVSPYLHFGHLSAQRIALDVLSHKSYSVASIKSFLEELIVRRELSDNFCLYNPHFDSVKGFPKWAQESLKLHKKDTREYLYTLKQFEKAKTHDPLWNAAQREMVTTGKMHGFMRMYWAKKILEWTESAEQALAFAQFLNDKYELDGNDPNGFVGVAWSIGGVHDRAWSERKVFGKVRYMNYNGCKRKFDVDAYIKRFV